MKRKILLLGGKTSLGSEFLRMATRFADVVHYIEDSDLHNQVSIKDALENLGIFDWIVNCYGRNQLDKIGRTPDGVQHMLIDNVAPIYYVVDELVGNGHPGARVLNVASQTYRIAQTNTAFYCASKAALVQLSKVMARELAEDGWVINCLAPGKIVDTDMAKITDQQVETLRGWNQAEAHEYALRNIPMRRFTTRAEVCEAMFKILELPAYINGTCIDMTGGA